MSMFTDAGPTSVPLILESNNSNENNNNNDYKNNNKKLMLNILLKTTECFPAHDELRACRTSLVFPEQHVLCICEFNNNDNDDYMFQQLLDVCGKSLVIALSTARL